MFLVILFYNSVLRSASITEEYKEIILVVYREATMFQMLYELES